MLYLINRKYEHISFNYFLLQIIPYRSKRKQQMHPNIFLIICWPVQRKCKNSVGVLLAFNTSLFRKDFLLRVFAVLYEQAV